jgi:hypothetical protein
MKKYRTKRGGEEKSLYKYFLSLHFRDNYFVTLSDTDEIDTVALMDHHHYYSVVVVKNFLPHPRAIAEIFLLFSAIFPFTSTSVFCSFYNERLHV